MARFIWKSVGLEMSVHHSDDGSYRVKNIAAVLYVLVMMFLVGGSYWHQQHPQPGGEVSANGGAASSGEPSRETPILK